ncbi:hypothetical protein [[Eubacterium] cellulosolvens]
MAGLNNSEYHQDFSYRQQVIDRVFELYSPDDIQSIFLPELIISNELELFQAAIMLFGSWENAIIKSGLGQETINRTQALYRDYWTSERVLEQLQTLQLGRFELSARFIKHVYPELYYTAINKMNFGSWVSALDNAEIEIEYVKSNANMFWTLSRIFKAVTDHFQAYGNLLPEFIREINPSLYSAAHRYYPTWSKAITAVGFSMQKNFSNVMLRPLRVHILMELIKNIYEALGIDYIVQPLDTSILSDESRTQAQTSPSSSSNLQPPSFILPPPSSSSSQAPSPSAPTISTSTQTELDLQEHLGITRFVLEQVQDNSKVCITATFHPWGFDTDREIFGLLTKYPRVICYHSIGEPRLWFGDRIVFKNVIQFYPELENHGKDELISALSHHARGGVPVQFQEHYSQAMKEINKRLKERNVTDMKK